MARLAVAMAVLVSTSCYATYDRGVAAANARDWPKAEAELWRYMNGGDCVGRRPPTLDCKRAAALLGEVLIEDDRPTSAATVLRLAQRFYSVRRAGTREVDRALDARITAGLLAAKERWTRFRSGVPGQCQLVARYRGPGAPLRAEAIWSELDMERYGPNRSHVETLDLFDKVTTAGPHAITLSATYADPARPGYYDTIETTKYRTCADGERIEIVFQIDAGARLHLEADAVVTGGQPTPLEGPLRPHPGFPGS